MHIANVKSLLFPYLFHLNIMHFFGLTDDLSQCCNTTVLWKHEPIDQICFPGFFLKATLGLWLMAPCAHPQWHGFCLIIGVYHALTPMGKWWWKEVLPAQDSSQWPGFGGDSWRDPWQPEDFSPTMFTSQFSCLDIAKCPDRFVFPFYCTQF